MIVFDLKCSGGHHFECWFGSSAAYEDQRKRALLECPQCGSNHVSKAVMAPNVTSKSNQSSTVSTASAVAENTAPVQAAPQVAGGQLPPEIRRDLDKVMERIRTEVSKKCDYVGDKFADEARKIHYGESDERGIYGEATQDETAELIDEGIQVLPLPGSRRSDA